MTSQAATWFTQGPQTFLDVQSPPQSIVRCKLLDGLAADAAIDTLRYITSCSRGHDTKGLIEYCMVQFLRSRKSCNDGCRAAASRLP